MLVYAGVGVWAFVFGRKTWSRPERMHDRWLGGTLPRRKWVLRAMAAVWVFIGFIALGSALVCLPPIRQRSGGTLLALVSFFSLVGTAITLNATRRYDSGN
jgi:hypothetical protein